MLVAMLGACSGPADSVDARGESEEAVHGCGVERWAVKTGTDRGAAGVDTAPIDTTLSDLVALAAPSKLPSSSRVAPTENQAFRLTNVTLAKFKLESDSDIHLVLTDGTNTMDAEIPSPACVGASSPFADAIAGARATFTAVHKPSKSFKYAGETVTVVGVGFFDMLHGQEGGAPNGIELHPVLSLCFGQDCAASQ